MTFEVANIEDIESGYRWLNDISQQFLEKDYLLPGQTVDERVNIIVGKAEQILGIKGFASRFKANIKKGWYSLSSPIWSNFGNKRGFPISCFGSYVEDTMGSILYTHGEVGTMSKYGGGTSAFLGALRGKGFVIQDNGKSIGAPAMSLMYDTEIKVVSQGSMRRGSMATYIPLDHPDIMDHLNMRSDGNAIQDLCFGVVVPRGWLDDLKDNWPKRVIMARVLEVRANTGFPYILFADNVNDGTVDVYKDLELIIWASNLCSEIMLPSSKDESFVCDLSSMNILYWHEWKDTDAVELLVMFLDAVMSEFIEKVKALECPYERHYLDRALRFAERHRALGVGWLGWHSFLQSQMIPFESMQAKLLNVQIAKHIKEKAYAASAKLAEMFGEPEILKGYGRRNTTLCAIAPTKSSSFILEQVSEGIEPFQSNSYIKDLAKGKFTFRNPYLEKVLEEKGKNTNEVWRSILGSRGSVQHLDFLSEHEKEVFKTFSEISMMEVIIQASARQKYIDQGQSLNLMIHPLTPPKDTMALILEAHRLGIKSLYYQKSVNAAQEFSRELVECVSCSA